MLKESLLIVWIVILPGLCYDYSQTGQHLWAKDYPQCAGYWQSPIVIAASRSVALPLPALELIGYRDYLHPPLVFKNNGYTVSMTVRNDPARRRNPYIFGALLNANQEYELESFHFHWGIRNSRGSEHLLHGIRYPLELHLIHRNMKYTTLETALKNADGLAVLGVFFILDEEENELLKPLLSHLADIKWPNTEVKLNNSLMLSWLMPKDLETYYTYRGSLTTPPCNEVVTWIVFATAVPISFKQMSKFRSLSNGKSVLADNFRFTQDIGNRKVYVRRTQYTLKQNVVDINTSSLKWYWS